MPVALAPWPWQENLRQHQRKTNETTKQANNNQPDAPATREQGYEHKQQGQQQIKSIKKAPLRFRHRQFSCRGHGAIAAGIFFYI